MCPLRRRCAHCFWPLLPPGWCGTTTAGRRSRPARSTPPGRRGALTALHLAFGSRATAHLFAGEFAEAASLAAEAEAVAEATGSAPYAALVTLAAFRGQEAEAAELTEAGTKGAQRRGEGGGVDYTHWAAAVLYNGLGRYEQALAAAQQASQDSPAHWFALWDWWSSSRRRREAGRPNGRLAPSTGCRRPPGLAGPTGRWASRPGRGRWSAAASTPRPSSAMRSTASAALACALSWAAPTCSTASGSAGRAPA